MGNSRSADAASSASRGRDVGSQPRLNSAALAALSTLEDTSLGNASSNHNSAAAASNDSRKSDEEKGAPAIRLQNGSRRLVSYFVLQEDKMTTAAVHRNEASSLIARLNISLNRGVGAQAGGSRLAGVTTTLEPLPSYYLLEDERVRPSCDPGRAYADVCGTTVRFPRGCKALRVYAFLLGGDKWVLYRNKVYPKQKRIIYVITAVDQHLNGYYPSTPQPSQPDQVERVSLDGNDDEPDDSILSLAAESAHALYTVSPTYTITSAVSPTDTLTGTVSPTDQYLQGFRTVSPTDQYLQGF